MNFSISLVDKSAKLIPMPSPSPKQASLHTLKHTEYQDKKFHFQDKLEDEFLFFLIQKGIMDSDLFLDEAVDEIPLPQASYATTLFIQNLIKTKRTIPIKTGTHEFSIQASLQEIFSFLYKKSPELGAPLIGLQIVGSMVPYFLGKEYFCQCIKLWLERRLSPQEMKNVDVLLTKLLEKLDIASPKDIDLRSWFAFESAQDANVANTLFLSLIQYLAANNPQPGLSQENLGHLIASQAFPHPKQVFAQNEKGHGKTQYLLIDFAKTEGKTIEWLLIHSLVRNCLFLFQDLELDVEAFALHNSAEVIVQGIFRNGHQAIADRLCKILHIREPETVDQNAWIKFIAALSKGYRCDEPEGWQKIREAVLKAQRPSFKSEGLFSTLDYLETLLTNFIQYNCHNQLKQGTSLYFNACQWLSDRIDTHILKQLWSRFPLEKYQGVEPAEPWYQIPKAAKCPGIRFETLSHVTQLIGLNALLTPAAQDTQKTLYYLTRHLQKPAIQVVCQETALLLPLAPCNAFDYFETNDLFWHDACDAQMKEAIESLLLSLRPSYDESARRIAPIHAEAASLSLPFSSIENSLIPFLEADLPGICLLGFEILLGIFEIRPTSHVQQLLIEYLPPVLAACPSPAEQAFLLHRLSAALSMPYSLSQGIFLPIDPAEIIALCRNSCATVTALREMWIKALTKTKIPIFCQAALKIWYDHVFQKSIPEGQNPLPQILLAKELIGNLLPELGDRAIWICKQLIQQKYIGKEQEESLFQQISESLAKEIHPLTRYRNAEAMVASASSLDSVAYEWIAAALHKNAKYEKALDILLAGSKVGKCQISNNSIRELGQALFISSSIPPNKRLRWYQAAKSQGICCLEAKNSLETLLPLFDYLAKQTSTELEPIEEEFSIYLQARQMEKEEKSLFLKIQEKRQQKLIFLGKIDQVVAYMEQSFADQLENCADFEQYLNLFHDCLDAGLLHKAYIALVSIPRAYEQASESKEMSKALAALLKKLCFTVEQQNHSALLLKILESRLPRIEKVIKAPGFLSLFLPAIAKVLNTPSPMPDGIFFLAKACELILAQQSGQDEPGTAALKQLFQKTYAVIETAGLDAKSQECIHRNFHRFFQLLKKIGCMDDAWTLFNICLESPKTPVWAKGDLLAIIEIILHKSGMPANRDVQEKTMRAIKKFVDICPMDAPETLPGLLEICLQWIKYLAANAPDKALGWLKAYENIPYVYRVSRQKTVLGYKLECLKKLISSESPRNALPLLEYLLKQNEGMNGEILHSLGNISEDILQLNPKIWSDIYLHKGNQTEPCISDERCKQTASKIALALLTDEPEKNLIPASSLLKTYKPASLVPWKIILDRLKTLQNSKVVQIVWNQWQSFCKEYMPIRPIPEEYFRCWQSSLEIWQKKKIPAGLEEYTTPLLLALDAVGIGFEEQQSFCDSLHQLLGDPNQDSVLLDKILSLPSTAHNAAFIKIVANTNRPNVFIKGCSLLASYVKNISSQDPEKILPVYINYLQKGKVFTDSGSDKNHMAAALVQLLHETEAFILTKSSFFPLFSVLAAYKNTTILFRTASLATSYAAKIGSCPEPEAPLVFERFIKELAQIGPQTYRNSAEQLFRQPNIHDIFSPKERAKLEAFFIIQRIESLKKNLDYHNFLAIQNIYLNSLSYLVEDPASFDLCMEKIFALNFRIYIEGDPPDFQRMWDSFYEAIQQYAHHRFDILHRHTKVFLHLKTTWGDKHAKFLMDFGENIKTLCEDYSQKTSEISELVEDFIIIAYSRFENEYLWAIQYAKGLVNFVCETMGLKPYPPRYVALLLLQGADPKELILGAPNDHLCQAIERIVEKLFSAGTGKSICYAIHLIQKMQEALLKHNTISLSKLNIHMQQAFSDQPVLYVGTTPFIKLIYTTLTNLFIPNPSEPKILSEFAFVQFYTWHNTTLGALTKCIRRLKKDAPSQISDEMPKLTELWQTLKFFAAQVMESAKQGVFLAKPRKFTLLISNMIECFRELASLDKQEDDICKDHLVQAYNFMFQLILNPKFISSPVIENNYLMKQWISASIASSNLSCIQLALNSLAELYTCPELIEFSVKEYWPLLSDIINGFCRILKEEVNSRKSIEKLLDAHAKTIFKLIGTPLCKEWKGPDNLQKRAQTMTLWLKSLASIRHGTIPDAMAISCYYIHLKAAKNEGSPPIYGPSYKELKELEKDLLTLKTT